jgi:AcrR family transcriptional regulator
MKNVEPNQYAAPRRGRGRPRAFDPDMALEKAMRLFWERGYEAASMDELTETMGLSPSSAYSAFGGKEQLFVRALDRYMAGPGAFPFAILHEPGPARAAFARLFEAVAREYTCADRPIGCMVAAAGSQSSPAAADVRAALVERRREAVVAYEDRLRRAREDGELPADADVAALARFFFTVVQGMSVQARDGAGEAELQGIGRQAMRAWPQGRTLQSE